MNCLNCQKELKQTDGKREKKYCNDTCRVAFFQKSKKKNGISPKYVLRESYERLFEQNQGILKTVADLEAENKALKKQLGDINTRQAAEVPKNHQKNASGSILTDEQKAAKIEELQKSANSCADTRLGRLSKAGYLKQIEELKK